MDKSIKYSNDNDNKVYHNTKILLRKYRKIVLGIEMNTEDIRYYFLENTGIDLFTLDTLASLLDLDLSNRKLESRILSMEKNRRMIAILNHAL